MNAQCTWFVLLTTFLSGCASPQTLKLDAPGEQRLSATDIVDVALSREDCVRKDPFLLALRGDSKLEVETGPVWQRVFRGNEGSAARLTIASAELRESISGAGFTMRYTYVVEAHLYIGSSEFPLKAQGTRAAAMAGPSAMRQAVELGVADIARQAAALLVLEGKRTR